MLPLQGTVFGWSAQWQAKVKIRDSPAVTVADPPSAKSGGVKSAWSNNP